jgi:uncharacterized membrane protein YjfL (UPF0719 family)
MMSQKDLLKHILIPLLVTAAFLMVVATPVELLGCRNRGLLAVGIALAGGLAGLACAAKGLVDKIRNNPDSGRWMISTLILALPVFYIVLFES